MNEVIEGIAKSIGVETNIVWIAIGAIGILLLQSLFKKRNSSSIDKYRSSLNTSIKVNSTTLSHHDSHSPTITSQGTMTVNVNGQDVSINPEVAQQIFDAIKNGNIIEAIKHMREVSSLSLTDSKQIVELMKKEMK